MSAFTAVNSEVYEDKHAKDESQGKWGVRGGVFLMLESSNAWSIEYYDIIQLQVVQKLYLKCSYWKNLTDPAVLPTVTKYTFLTCCNISSFVHQTANNRHDQYSYVWDSVFLVVFLALWMPKMQAGLTDVQTECNAFHQMT